MGGREGGNQECGRTTEWQAIMFPKLFFQHCSVVSKDPVPRDVHRDVPRNTFPVYSEPNPATLVKPIAQAPFEQADTVTIPAQSVDEALGMWNLQGER